MNLKVLETLEFDKVKQGMFKYSITHNCKSMIQKLAPFTTVDDVNRNLNDTEEAVYFVKEFQFPDFTGLSDVSSLIQKINKSGMVTTKEIYKIGTTLKCIRVLKDYLKRGTLNYLNFYFENIHTFKTLEDSILKVVEEDGESVSDFASQDLFNIRKELKSKRAEIKRNLSGILKTYSSYLQDNVFTVRGDRYCIPVKAEFKSQVKGIVHNQSSSGSTYFIEPLVLVNLNNEINELIENEKDEIRRILRVLCLKIKDNFEYIDVSLKNVYELEFIFCKAGYATETESVRPIISESSDICLISARHPLIEKSKVVPLTLNFSNDRDAIIITGPNTGGKTVTLKTLGLVHVMALSGMFIPAYEGSKVMFLNEIFVDIGDEQSIEKSLSTFSSHIKNMVNIIENLKQKNLILLDEVGSGTDPEEGSALAISMIEYFINMKCKVMGTTHYSQLKTYAINSKNIENASMEFDIDTLKPTYKLNVGIPGKSNAFIISKSLGMRAEIIDNASNYLSGDTIKMDAIIKSLEEKASEALKNNREIEILREENKILNEKLKKRLDNIEKEKIKIIDSARLESEKIVSDAKKQIDYILKTVNELEINGISSKGIKDLEAARREIKRKADEDNRIREEKRKLNLNKSNSRLREGSIAFLGSIGQNVTLLNDPDSKGEVSIQAGNIKLNINVNELNLISDGKVNKISRDKKDIKLRINSMPMSLDLRGLDTLDAVDKVDKYLDDAFVYGMGEVSIIHGKGTGALRKAVSDLLRTHVHVKSYRLGEYGEGGHGVTIVKIK